MTRRFQDSCAPAPPEPEVRDFPCAAVGGWSILHQRTRIHESHCPRNARRRRVRPSASHAPCVCSGAASSWGGCGTAASAVLLLRVGCPGPPGASGCSHAGAGSLPGAAAGPCTQGAAAIIGAQHCAQLAAVLERLAGAPGFDIEDPAGLAALDAAWAALHAETGCVLSELAGMVQSGKE